jgi:universal stress protein A
MTTETLATGFYRRILVAVDLTDDSAQVATRARAIAAACGAELSFLHVVDYRPIEPLGETLLPTVEIEAELVRRGTERLRGLARDIGLADSPCRVAAGSIKAEIVGVARELSADLIVLGSRERHGLSILVNLTEDTVLHAAPCDVLAVRLK